MKPQPANHIDNESWTTIFITNFLGRKKITRLSVIARLDISSALLRSCSNLLISCWMSCISCWLRVLGVILRSSRSNCSFSWNRRSLDIQRQGTWTSAHKYHKYLIITTPSFLKQTSDKVQKINKFSYSFLRQSHLYLYTTMCMLPTQYASVTFIFIRL